MDAHASLRVATWTDALLQGLDGATPRMTGGFADSTASQCQVDRQCF